MRLLGIAFIFVFGLGLTSCTRDYYCTCEYVYTGTGKPPNSKEVTTIKDTKKNANFSCENRNEMIVDNNGDTTFINCHLN